MQALLTRVFFHLCDTLCYSNSQTVSPLFLGTLQTSDSDQHPLLDRAASQRPFAVAGQGTHTDGLSQHPLLQCVVGAAFSSTHLNTNHIGKLERLSVQNRKETPFVKLEIHSSPLLSLNISPHMHSTFLSTIPLVSPCDGYFRTMFFVHCFVFMCQQETTGYLQ